MTDNRNDILQREEEPCIVDSDDGQARASVEAYSGRQRKEGLPPLTENGTEGEPAAFLEEEEDSHEVQLGPRPEVEHSPVKESESSRRSNFFVTYLRRLKGAGKAGPPFFSPTWDAVPSFFLSAVTLLVLVIVDQFGLLPYNLGLISLLPSFGAACALVVCLLTSPGAQPRSIILTTLVGAFFGISWAHITSNLPKPLGEQLASAFAVAMVAPILMVTGAFQPSATATACLAAFYQYGEMNDQGFMFLLTPALVGSCVIVFMGWMLNNLVPWRHCYPLWL